MEDTDKTPKTVDVKATQSLHSFSKQYGIPKTTLRRWLNESGFDTSNGLDDAARNAALKHFKPQKQNKVVENLPGEGLARYEAKGYGLVEFDSRVARSEDKSLLLEQLQVFMGNSTALATALLNHSAEQGRQLGHQMTAIKIRTALQTAEELQDEIGESMGIKENPES